MISVNGVEIKPETFPDGTKKIDVDEVMMNYLLKEHHTNYFSDRNHFDIRWVYESDEELFSLYCISRTLKEECPNILQRLSMPYIPNARFDRIKNTGECFTLKYFSEIINSLGFVRVMVQDPHSDVSTALINNVGIKKVYREINQAVEYIEDVEKGKNLVIYFPDNGSLKRYSGQIPADLPIVYGVKNRDWGTGEILGIEIHGQTDQLNEDTAILMIDDICSKGGTFYYGSKELEKYGCKTMYLYVTHCENTILDGKLLKEDSLFKRVFTTNSIFTAKHEKVEVFE